MSQQPTTLTDRRILALTRVAKKNHKTRKYLEVVKKKKSWQEFLAK